MNFEYDKDNKERIPFEHYLEAYQKANPVEISKRVGVPYDEDKKVFDIWLLGSRYQISHPEYEITHIDDEMGYYPLEAINAKILILRYFLEGKLTPAGDEFYTYKEMPWGDVYFKQFQGRCMMRLAYGYGNKLSVFSQIMKRMGATQLSYGDCAYEIEFLKGLRLRYILWSGDEEFPPSAQIQFSDNFPEAFQIEDMAFVCDIITGMIKALEKAI
jgi:hypothetical protein